MSSLNKAILIGRLGRDPDSRKLQNGDSVCNFSLATSSAKDKVDWHVISVYGKQAENCAKHCFKGGLVCVEGEIKNQTWQGKDGTQKSGTIIQAYNVRFLERKPEAKAPAASASGEYYDNNNYSQDNLPF
jgi:single-strand DNA-binding protein